MSHQPAASASATAPERRVDDAARFVLADSVAQPTTTEAGATTRPSLRDDPRAIRWRNTIFWSTIIIFVGVVASIAIVRFSRRYVAYLKDDPPPPTASEDVWSMHRLPPGALDEPGNHGSSSEPDELSDDEARDDDEPPPPG